MTQEGNPKYVKYIVRVALTNKPVMVTNSLAAAMEFCKQHGKKRLWIDKKVIE